MDSRGLRELTLTALFVALVTVATMVVQVPVPATGGFINVGDTMIFVAALVGGPKAGLIAGGLGSALADLLSGYAMWAPWTLVIKGLEGLLAAVLAFRAYRMRGALSVATLAGLAIAGLWMVLGYYVAGGIIRGFAPALTEVPGNLIQAFGSVILATPVLMALRGLNVTDRTR
ncbi:MAG: ECF transporter S component [Bacillota bacterium]|nr:ECF transporter S component [Bacillota bacterium]